MKTKIAALATENNRNGFNGKRQPSNEAEWKALVKHLDEMVIVFDNAGIIRYLNPFALRRLGYVQYDVTGLYIEKILHRFTNSTLKRKFLEKNTDVINLGKRNLITKDGRHIPVKSKVILWKLIGDDNFIGIFRDGSSLNDIESALMESERKLTTLMSTLPGMAYRCKNNRSWTMEFVSDGCYELTGYKKSELINNKVISFYDLTEPEYREKIYQGVQEALEKRQFFRIVFLMRTKSGQKKWVWEQGVGIYSENGDVIALEGFITDITEHQQSKIQLLSENVLLKSNVKESYKFCGLVGRSPVMQTIFDLILKAGKSNANVIIYGESGTGKELAARAIHKMSFSRDRPFVPVNCGAIPENLIESEFFGYKKGAFSGADQDNIGLLDQAEGGTLFLDEIGDINLNLQVKLLRAIEGSGFKPVGAGQLRKPQFRVIAATNSDLMELIEKGLMREDFFLSNSYCSLAIAALAGTNGRSSHSCISFPEDVLGWKYLFYSSRLDECFSKLRLAWKHQRIAEYYPPVCDPG